MTKIQVVTARKRQYRQYDENVINNVIAAIKKKEISINKAAKKFKISKGTLINRVNNQHTKPVGCPLVLSKTEEDTLIAYIVTVSNWGFPFDKNDLCHLTKLYLDKCQRKVRQFKDNLPTRQWAGRFLKRHVKELSHKKCQNLKRNKAELKEESMRIYFDNLRETLTEEDGSFVPPHRIFNYDETNLSDDPGTKRCIFKRGVKYPERIMDSSKSSTSLMFCGSATGALLPPYVVYKSKHLYNEWMKGGPLGTRYNRSKSGWFDAIIFQDWFEEMFIPHVKQHKLNEHGKVVIIGDNLSSHFSPKVLNLCEENHVSFACLPKNSTHLTQPLDVAFYSPLKTFWRGILEKWKKGLQKKSQTITKEKFPGLLNQVCIKIGGEDSQSDQLVSGFKKTGIFPFNPDAVICRLPGSTNEADTSTLVSESVLEMLKDLRNGESSEKKNRKTKLNVQPGKSIGCEDLPKLLTPAHQNNNKAEKMRVKLRKMIKGKKMAKGKVMKNSSKMTKSKKVKDGKNVTKKLAKDNSSKKTVVSDGEESETAVITKNKLSNGRSKIRVVMSDSESDKIELISKTVKKKVRGKVLATLDVTKSKQLKRKKITDAGKKMTKQRNATKIWDSDTDQSIEEIFEKSFQPLVRPSISEVIVGDYVLIEYILNQCKKHYIGMVKTIGRDVIGVLFLLKSDSKFMFAKGVEETTILPTQIVKILQLSKLEKGKLIFHKHDVHGFNFA